MTNIKKIAFYDHDGTLMDVPMPDTGRDQWKAKTGQEYPHKGWWGQPDSLNTQVFDIKPFPSILAKLNQDNADPETLTVLLTNRIPRMQFNVMTLLHKHDIKLDAFSFKTDEKNKRDRIMDILKKYPSVEEVTVYDDQADQIDILRSFKKELGDVIKVEIFKATNGQTQLIEAYETLEHKIKKDVKKYL